MYTYFCICRMTSLLQDVYDKTHSGRLMSENVVLGRLHLRPGKVEGPDVDDSMHPKMHYDERYTKCIRQTGLLPFVQLVVRGILKFNPCAISALVDRWRPETHTFHLPCGEMTVTLQDVAMITALPIKGDLAFWGRRRKSHTGPRVHPLVGLLRILGDAQRS